MIIRRSRKHSLAPYYIHTQDISCADFTGHPKILIRRKTFLRGIGRPNPPRKHNASPEIVERFFSPNDNKSYTRLEMMVTGALGEV